jgi:hypothetical protein
MFGFAIQDSYIGQSTTGAKRFSHQCASILPAVSNGGRSVKVSHEGLQLQCHRVAIAPDRPFQLRYRD